MGLHQEGASAVMVSLLSLSDTTGNRTETPGEDRRLPMFQRQDNTTGGSSFVI